jgi:hypothetical protein
MYLLRDTMEPLLYCYLYQASDPNDVSTRFSLLTLAMGSPPSVSPSIVLP